MTASSVVIHAFADEARPAQALADALGIEFALIDLHTFPDGELLPTIAAPANTTIVYRSLARPNDKLIALFLACEAWRRGGARRLVLAARLFIAVPGQGEAELFASAAGAFVVRAFPGVVVTFQSTPNAPATSVAIRIGRQQIEASRR